MIPPDPSRAVEAPVAGPWIDPDPSRPLPLGRSLRDDVIAHVPPEHYPRSRARWIFVGLRVALRSSGFRVVALYRFAHTLRGRLGPPGRLGAALVFWLIRHLYGCSIASTARLHGGLILPHPQGIVIGPGAVVGPRAWIYQNVTIGGTPGKSGLPAVGSDSRLYAGAVLAGPVHVGDRVVVGANAVVVRDVPQGSLVRVAPVEILPRSPHPVEGQGG